MNLPAGQDALAGLDHNTDVLLSDELRRAKIDISVIMLTFNHMRFFSTAFESVLNQQIDCRLEILIGDDSSTDGTDELVCAVQQQHPDRVVAVLRKKNLGVWGKYNLSDLLYRARGDYLAFLEGDDYWADSGKLDLQMQSLKQNPKAVFCFGNARVLIDGHGFTDALYTPAISRPVTAADLLSGRIKVPTASVLLRRDRALPLPPWYQDIKASDYPLWFGALRFGPALYLDKILSVYRVHSAGVFTQGVGASNPSARFFENADARIRYFKLLKNGLVSEDRAEARVKLATACAAKLNECRSNGDSVGLRAAIFELLPVVFWWRNRSIRWLCTSLILSLFPPLHRWMCACNDKKSPVDKTSRAIDPS